MVDTRRSSAHWDAAYRSGGFEGVSWYQPFPAVSLELVEALGVSPDAAVLDVGGGGSSLAERLAERGFRDVTVLDVSSAALEAT
jgi:2-polyprenyl-3-methyl-5-hydroxy-6-metoxy-1,4-benzoquinol methylase